MRGGHPHSRRILLAPLAGEYLAALDIGLAVEMSPSVDTYRRRFTDEEIVEFLRLVQTELRKPLPGRGRDISVAV